MPESHHTWCVHQQRSQFDVRNICVYLRYFCSINLPQTASLLYSIGYQPKVSVQWHSEGVWVYVCVCMVEFRTTHDELGAHQMFRFSLLFSSPLMLRYVWCKVCFLSRSSQQSILWNTDTWKQRSELKINPLFNFKSKVISELSPRW